ncbi:hypothetical protein [Nannocystis bainbridge]|nr:hypothetical protein [Nannocystis bainbridge]
MIRFIDEATSTITLFFNHRGGIHQPLIFDSYHPAEGGPSTGPEPVLALL